MVESPFLLDREEPGKKSFIGAFSRERLQNRGEKGSMPFLPLRKPAPYVLKGMVTEASCAYFQKEAKYTPGEKGW